MAILHHSFHSRISSAIITRWHPLYKIHPRFPDVRIRSSIFGSTLNPSWMNAVLNCIQRRSSSSKDFGMHVKELSIEADSKFDQNKDISFDVSSYNQEKLENGLYLVATPIGNLEDITLRALRVLKSVDLILAEDTRHSAKILQHYNIGKPMMSYHKFNATARQEALVKRLESGQTLALITDAGTPGISDPGSELVMTCIKANIRVHPIPGPSAVITAIIASGLATKAFTFVGFLPTQERPRQKRLMAAANESATQIFFVPPHKLCSLIESCIPVFGPTRRCVVAREMTKLHEEFWRGTFDEAQKEFQARDPRGEVTLLVEGLPDNSLERFPTLEELESRLKDLINAGESPSEAARRVAEETAVRRKLIYTLALKLSSQKGQAKT